MTQAIKTALTLAFNTLKGNDDLSQALSDEDRPKHQRTIIRDYQMELDCDTDNIAGVAGREMLRRALLEEWGAIYEDDTPLSQYPFVDFLAEDDSATESDGDAAPAQPNLLTLDDKKFPYMVVAAVCASHDEAVDFSNWLLTDRGVVSTISVNTKKA